MQSPTAGSTRANVGLDAANFFLADVRDGLGPYLAIYLLTIQKWDEASIGVVMSIATAAGIVAADAGRRADRRDTPQARRDGRRRDGGHRRPRFCCRWSRRFSRSPRRRLRRMRRRPCSGPGSPPSRSASSGTPRSRGGSAATNRSIMPAMPSPLPPRARRLISGGPASSFICSPHVGCEPAQHPGHSRSRHRQRPGAWPARSA